MFGSVGMQEVILILFILLLLFGSKRLPELGQSLGKVILDFKRGVSEIQEEIGKDDAFRVSLLMDRLERLSGDELEEEEED